MKPLLMITGNEDKFREFKEILGKRVILRRKKIDLPELQGSPEDIVKAKAKLAAKMTGKTCFVDDTSLCFDAWGCMPGPYIKDFLTNVGVKKLAKLLTVSSKNHKASAITSIGYCEPNKNPICVQGITRGKILLARGNKNFKKGWDQIFMPNGESRTYAQMDSYEKHKYSQRKKAIIKFESFLSGF